MTKKGDTHGWHWDDYTYSLVWILETPSPDVGGITEFITNTQWNKKNPEIVNHYLSNRQIHKRFHMTNDVYLLKANTTMHRVSPLGQDALRVILNMEWANNADIAKNISHETMEEIYV